ncbi:MAG: GyrI-like domain-containing protein [Niameybacter sp.]|uniref:GyrI-like domain-containing protein n=1 Tax=Niameybacter sp. TaxID=2033640 RepID=UPI002FCBFF47
MTYEIVNLEAKSIVGASARTGNGDPQMGQIIGGLWNQLYQEGISATIEHKVNGYAVGLYSNYEGDTYCVTVGHEVAQVAPSTLSTKEIPGGRYARFFVKGHMQKAVAEAWETIWQLDLERSFTGDFEEYLNCDFEQAELYIYIGLK